MFGIDTNELTMALGRPVLNLGLHAGLPLETILKEAGAAAESGDAIVLPLEPFYYSREDPTNWQIRNIIAWEPERWRALSVPKRIKYLARLEPSTFLEIVTARVQSAIKPAALSARLAAFEDPKILARFATSPPPAEFAYSAYHLDRLGNMQHAIGHLGMKGTPAAGDARIEIAPAQRTMLRTFVATMRGRGISVFFAHAPVVASPHATASALDEASASFARDMSDIGRVIDDRRQVVYPETLFFDTDLHLNAEGRALRTAELLTAIRRHVIEPPNTNPR